MRTPHPGWLEDSTGHRSRLVESLVASGAIRSAPVREAFTEVPRELFVPAHAMRHGVAAVYADEVLITAADDRGVAVSSSSQPALMAAMLENLDVTPGVAVLEIGTGTGYNAALLTRLVGPQGRVVSVEVDPAVAGSAAQALSLGGYPVDVVVGDGTLGHAPGRPYDRIEVTASSEVVAEAWVDQLAEGGVLEVPLRLNGGETQAVVTFRLGAGRLHSTGVLSGRFMPMRGPGRHGARDAVLALAGPDGSKVRLAGASTARLSVAARDALEASLGTPRRRVLEVVAPTWDLVMFLSLEVPTGTLVSRWPELSVGVLEPDGGLALLVGSWGGGSTPRAQEVLAYGPSGAQDRLVETIARWDALGRPGVADLVIEVDRPVGSIRHHWRRPAVTT